MTVTVEEATAKVVSHTARRVTDILLLKNPVATSMGIVFGYIVYELVHQLNPALLEGFPIDVLGFSAIYFSVVGMFLFNIYPSIRRERFPPTVQMTIDYIKEAQRSGKLSDEQVRIMYVSLYQKVLEQVNLDEDTKGKMRKLDEIIQLRDVTQ